MLIFDRALPSSRNYLPMNEYMRNICNDVCITKTVQLPIRQRSTAFLSEPRQAIDLTGWSCPTSNSRVSSQLTLASANRGALAKSLRIPEGLKQPSISMLESPSSLCLPWLVAMTRHATKSSSPPVRSCARARSLSWWFMASTPSISSARNSSIGTIQHDSRENRDPTLEWGRGMRWTIIPYLSMLEKDRLISIPTSAAKVNDRPNRAAQCRRCRRRGGSPFSSRCTTLRFARFISHATLWYFQCFSGMALRLIF